MNINHLENLMNVAVEEARISLREGNSGFGAVIEKDGVIIAQTHDTEKATDELIRRLHPKLRFSRNYEKIRPYSEYCEEMISFDVSDS